jgi:hypothetical protein
MISNQYGVDKKYKNMFGEQIPKPFLKDVRILNLKRKIIW